MPIYCELIQLVIPKKILIEKYEGGIEQCKLDLHWGKYADHEDEELISITSMENGFPIPKWLHHDEATKTSKDFVIVGRYASTAFSWEVDWCKTNRVFIWHKDCKLSSYEKMMEISNSTRNQNDEALKRGEKPFSDIW